MKYEKENLTQFEKNQKDYNINPLTPGVHTQEVHIYLNKLAAQSSLFV